MRAYLSIAMLLVVLAGCKKPNERSCWKAHGEAVGVNRNITDFNEIEVHDAIKLIIVQDTANGVVVHAAENTEPFVNAGLRNGVLVLTNENKCDFLRSYDQSIEVYVYCKDLTKVVKYSSADIISSNAITSDTFRLESYNGAGDVSLKLNTNSAQILIETGPSDVVLSGQTDHLYLYHTGNGNARTTSLNCRHTHVSSYTTGEFHVYASELLNAEIYSYGNVYYSGNPDEIILTRTNRGELIQE